MNPKKSTFRYAVVLDFEATCQEGPRIRPQEIIEFTSVLVDVKSGEVIDEFESFVRPQSHAVLSDFCTELTSTQQVQVDGAPFFEDVWQEHQAWLDDHGLNQTNAMLCTCGDWDLQLMLPAQLKLLQPTPNTPTFYTSWCNLKRLYSDVTNEKAKGMSGMLRRFGLPLLGHHHRGIDDCRNLAHLLQVLLEKGAELRETASLESGRRGHAEQAARKKPR
ncbi:MAG: exonuclease domain-containing protein [Deltaproteobacteria bacterium]|nr:exonuclease domain-containing protein [Deltaproteobacteria bacterium]